MRYDKYIQALFISSIACAVSLSAGCGSEPQKINNDFSSLCELSGGKMTSDGQFCKCGEDEDTAQICSAGIVCSENNKNLCAVKTELKCEKAGERVCSEGRVSYCTERKEWKPESKSCDNGCNDTNDGCKGECKDGDSKCSDDGDLVFMCKKSDTASDNNRFVYNAKCDLGCFVTNTNHDYCTECQDDERRCNENSTEKCVSGKWVKEYNYCTVCKNGAKRCTYKEGTPNIGYPQTCINGQWSPDLNDPLAEPCPNQSSCRNTLQVFDGELLEMSECGSCQDNVQTACVDKKESLKDVGHLYTCKNGSFEEIISPNNADVTVEMCVNDDACLIKDAFVKCKNNSCACGENNCKDGEYCSGGNCMAANDTIQACKDAPCWSASAFVKCENNSCDCGEQMCQNGQFCKNNQTCVDAVSNQSACAGNVSCAFKYDECFDKNGCSDTGCAYQEYFVDGVCLKPNDEHKRQEFDFAFANIQNWVCGDCQNDPNKELSVVMCGSDALADDCHNKVLANIPFSMTKVCMASSDPSNCFSDKYRAFCYLTTCQNFDTKKCDELTDKCFGYHNPYHECGVSSSTEFYHYKNIVPCLEESCACGSTTCHQGQVCTDDSKCYDKDGADVEKCVVGPCACGEQSCATDQYCVKDTNCVDTIVDVSKKIQCKNSSCSRCNTNSCSCGEHTCNKNQFCVGTGSDRECKSLSEAANLLPVIQCKADSCQCGVLSCSFGEYCVDNKECVSKIDDSVAIYEFVDSYHYKCNQIVNGCDAGFKVYNDCVKKNSSEYLSCIKQCKVSDCAGVCNHDDCESACNACTSNCSAIQSAADNACTEASEQKAIAINNQLWQFAESGTCKPIDNNTTKQCRYSCTFGRNIPFNTSDACESDDHEH